MTKKTLQALAAAAAILVSTNAASAQTRGTAEEVVAAAVDYERSALQDSGVIPEDSRIGLDIAVIHHDPLVGKRENRTRAEAVALLTGVLAADAAEAIRCDEGPPSCRMDFHAFLTFSEPVLERDSARVVVLRRFWTPKRTRQPISWSEWELTLARLDGRWTVVTAEPISQS